MIKNVVTQLGEEALEQATLALAKRFQAHVLGLHPLARPRLPTYAEMSLTEVAAREWKRVQEGAHAQERRFLAAAAAAGVSAEALVEEADAGELFLEWGRLADLVVLGQPREEAMSPSEDVLLALGRPVLMIPYAGSYPQLGDSVVVAWNGTRESALAVHCAMPFLAHAKKAALVGVDLDGPQRQGARRLVANLARHGVDLRLELLPAGDVPVGDVLLNAVADLGADLLVMGAYGHSRMRELVFGGATRSLLTQMTAPTLFAH